MSWRRIPSKSDARSKYGLPKNVVVSVRHGSIPPAADAWQKARDDFEGELRDLLDALRSGLISRLEYDHIKSRLTQARWNSEQQYEHSMRFAARQERRSMSRVRQRARSKP